MATPTKQTVPQLVLSNLRNSKVVSALTLSNLLPFYLG